MTKSGDDLTEEDRARARISEMKQQLASAPGGMVAWESDSLSCRQREEFWRQVTAFENGPFTTDFERLVSAGVDLPAPDALDDERLPAKHRQ